MVRYKDDSSYKCIAMEIFKRCQCTSLTVQQLKSLESLKINKTVFIKKCLTKQESVVLFWVSQGVSLKEIAGLLDVKFTTVLTYSHRIKKKLECQTLAHAVFKGVKFQDKGAKD